MSCPSESRPLTYGDTVRIFNASDVQEDLNDACGKLATVMGALMQKFDSITKQMHTIDMLRLNAPLRPKWDLARQDFAELLWQFRTNSSVISGRLKLLCASVLPMASRNVDSRSGERSPYQTENIQVLKSYMAISAEHAAMTRTLANRTGRLSAHLVTFVAEFTKLATRHAASGQSEMSDLSQQLSDLESYIQRVFTATSEINNVDVTHLAYTASRLVSSAGRNTGRSRITRKRIVLDEDLLNVGRAYENADRKRNEVAHAQYAAQLRQDRADPMAAAHTALSAFVLELMLTAESALGIMLSIWARLRVDCSEVYHWVKNPQMAVPSVMTYLETGCTVYAPLANALDVYATTMDTSVHPPERREVR